MLIEIEGIILSETPYGETSKIINVITKEKGVIGIMCKGAKSMKSPLRALTMPYTYCNFYIYYKENKLSTLKDIDLINSFNRIKQDIMLISYVNYLSELTSQVAKTDYNEDLFKIFSNCLIKIDMGFDPLVITNILEIKYLDYLGISLNLDGCVSCGSNKEIITVDGDMGGYICKKCYNNEKIVNSKVIKLLRMYYLIDINHISDIKIEDKVKLEINYFLNRYYDRYTGLYLKSKKFLDELNNI
ncbi:MAG: DNA repair protein RecO [Firmicutes bacterium]|nr:DNA repair protein RecO [Bacillota bacterium]